VASPLSAFDDWFCSQSPGIQSDLVALALAHLPGSGVDFVDMLGDDIVTPFRASLEVLETEGSAFQQVCAVVAMRSAIDFFVIRQRGSRSSWKITRQLNRRAYEEIAAEGHSPAFLDSFFEHLPFREKQWLRAAEGWRELCANALSDETLDAWLQKASLGDSL
jgi:hypothetical protein